MGKENDLSEGEVMSGFVLFVLFIFFLLIFAPKTRYNELMRDLNN